MQQIKNVRELRQALVDGKREFTLLLNGGLCSSKHITPYSGGRFGIVNYIDGTTQRLTARQLHTHSNIGKAMRLGSFLAETTDNY
jgi:hypothetical protein